MEDGRIVYEVEVLLNGVEHDFDIDAHTGDVLKWDQELDEDDDKNNGQQGTVTTPTTAVIGLDRAKEIAQGRLPAARSPSWSWIRRTDAGSTRVKLKPRSWRQISRSTPTRARC